MFPDVSHYYYSYDIYIINFDLPMFKCWTLHTHCPCEDSFDRMYCINYTMLTFNCFGWWNDGWQLQVRGYLGFGKQSGMGRIRPPNLMWSDIRKGTRSSWNKRLFWNVQVFTFSFKLSSGLKLYEVARADIVVQCRLKKRPGQLNYHYDVQ